MCLEQEQQEHKPKSENTKLKSKITNPENNPTTTYTPATTTNNNNKKTHSNTNLATKTPTKPPKHQPTATQTPNHHWSGHPNTDPTNPNTTNPNTANTMIDSDIPWQIQPYEFVTCGTQELRGWENGRNSWDSKSNYPTKTHGHATTTPQPLDHPTTQQKPMPQNPQPT